MKRTRFVVGGEPMTSNNFTNVGVEVKTRELAVMDWANTPSGVIRETLDLSMPTLARYRESDVYKETIDQLRREWNEEMLKLPATAELRKKIAHGMALSLNVLIQILGGKAQAKDKIAAARLMAQLDGRFLKENDGDGLNSKGESLAQELINVMNRQRVQ